MAHSAVEQCTGGRGTTHQLYNSNYNSVEIALLDGDGLFNYANIFNDIDTFSDIDVFNEFDDFASVETIPTLFVPESQPEVAVQHIVTPTYLNLLTAETSFYPANELFPAPTGSATVGPMVLELMTAGPTMFESMSAEPRTSLSMTAVPVATNPTIGNSMTTVLRPIPVIESAWTAIPVTNPTANIDHYPASTSSESSRTVNSLPFIQTLLPSTGDPAASFSYMTSVPISSPQSQCLPVLISTLSSATGEQQVGVQSFQEASVSDVSYSARDVSVTRAKLRGPRALDAYIIDYSVGGDIALAHSSVAPTTTTGASVVVDSLAGVDTPAEVGTLASTKPEQKSCPCPLCAMRFRRSSDLARHILTHDKSRPFSCDRPGCGAAFPRSYELVRHRTVHEHVKAFRCSQCGKEFARLADAKRHEKAHGGERPYACEECGKCFPHAHELKRHEKIHRTKPYVCNAISVGGRLCGEAETDGLKCGRRFVCAWQLKKHARQHGLLSGDDAVLRGSDSSKGGDSAAGSEDGMSEGILAGLGPLLESAEVSADGILQWTCAAFGSSAGSVGDTSGIESAEGSVVGVSIRQSDEESAGAERSVGVGVRRSGEESAADKCPVRSYKCDKCKKSCASQRALAQHARMHTGASLYQCRLCVIDFSSTAGLKRHNKSEHTTHRPYLCDACPKRFSVPGALQRHAQSHSCMRAYRCSACAAQFNSSCALQRHIRTHTGERPFVCLTCNGSFVQKGDLTKHIRTHTGERPFSCAICSLAFAQKSSLTAHARTHSSARPFVCTVCTLGFRHAAVLRNHMRTHTGEKPFSCVHCARTFSRSYHLLRHMPQHLSCELAMVNTGDLAPGNTGGVMCQM